MSPIEGGSLLTSAPLNSRRRSFAKTVTWRIVAELDTFLISYIITGSLSWSLTIVGFETTTKTLLYYVHERAWGHIAWGSVRPAAPVRTPRQDQADPLQREVL
ncbi:MAG: hypothetical protein NVSMB18_28800 [Acetobacteraceae bacterium]